MAKAKPATQAKKRNALEAALDATIQKEDTIARRAEIDAAAERIVDGVGDLVCDEMNAGAVTNEEEDASYESASAIEIGVAVRLLEHNSESITKEDALLIDKALKDGGMATIVFSPRGR